MKKNILSLGMVLLLTACAVVTVNIYFPERQVQMAFEAIEEEIYSNLSDTSAADGGVKEETVKERKNSFLILGTKAYAGDTRRDELLFKAAASSIQTKPAAEKAMARRKSRGSKVIAALDKNYAGVNRRGLLEVVPPELKEIDIEELIVTLNVALEDEADTETIRFAAQKALKELIEDENKDRRTIVELMANEILELTGQEVSDESLEEALEKTFSVYGQTIIKNAATGWYVKQDGKWMKVKPPSEKEKPLSLEKEETEDAPEPEGEKE